MPASDRKARKALILATLLVSLAGCISQAEQGTYYRPTDCKISSAGTLGSECVRKIIDHNESSYSQAFQHAISQNLDVNGGITLQLQIAENGDVLDVKPVDQYGNLPETFIKKICLITKAIKFPAAPAVTIIAHSFNFSS